MGYWRYGSNNHELSFEHLPVKYVVIWVDFLVVRSVIYSLALFQLVGSYIML